MSYQEQAQAVKKTYTIQENGQVTLPMEWRKRYGLEKGDFVTFEETDDGQLLVSPKQAQMIKLLDEIGEALKEKGITLEDMIESGREIRGQMIKEKYGIDPDPND